MPEFDAVVIRAGPNGLAAGITLARAGCKVLVLEARETIGGSSRTAELTSPGFQHDICSAIHPLGLAAPFLRSLPSDALGVERVHPPAALAHRQDSGLALIPCRDAAQMGTDDQACRRPMEPLVAN